MSRPLRIQLEGAVFHAMARGNARSAIFVDDDDRTRFLGGLEASASRFDWAIWAYCLMPNHYHLLIQTRAPTLSRGMHHLNGHYAQSFNRRHERVGHLFQGRFKAISVQKIGYLAEVARYIVLNPVRAGLCSDPLEWAWSSYRATMGLEAALPSAVDVSFLSQFGAGLQHSRASFAAFVKAGLALRDPPSPARSPLVNGSPTFEAALMAGVSTPDAEVPKAQRTRQTLANYQRLDASRDRAIQVAYSSGAYTLKEIGAHFGLGYPRISRIARRQLESPVEVQSGPK